MDYDGCTVQMMDQLIDLTSQVNLRVEELKRTGDRPGKLDKLDKLPNRGRARRRPRDSMLRVRAAMPGPTLSPTKSSFCTSSPLSAAEATHSYPKPNSSAAGVHDGDLGMTSKSDFTPSSPSSSYLSSTCTYSSFSFPPPHTTISKTAAFTIPATSPTETPPPPPPLSSRPHRLPTPPGSSSSTKSASLLAIPDRPPPTLTDHRAAIGPAPIPFQHRQISKLAVSATPAQHCRTTGADHTHTRLSTDGMPLATLSPPREAANASSSGISLDSITARKSHSSYSNRNPPVHRSHGRWRKTSARSARSYRYLRSVRSFDHLHLRSPSPMFNPFARESRQRHTDGVDTAVRSRSSGGLMSNMGMSPSSMSPRTSNGRVRRSYSTGRRALASDSNPPPPLTREEYEALPVAIQRKYFSTLERLRFAQSSSAGQADGDHQHYSPVTAHNIRRHRTRRDGIVSDSITTRLRRKRSVCESAPIIGSSIADTLFYASLPDKIRKREFTREEQLRLAEQLRASVILDAADEAIYKIGRRSSVNRRRIAPDFTKSFRHSMDTIHSNDPRLSRRDALGLEVGPSSPSIKSKRISGVPESFYDSFNWLEEDEDLDLRLFLDDYHNNLRDQLPSSQSSQSKDRQPSFRRHLSVRKPFSRPPQISTTGGTGVSRVSSIGGGSSIAGTRPATKDEMFARPAASPALSSSGSVPFPSLPEVAGISTSPEPTTASTSASATHVRRTSRALSLIAPKQHSAQPSVSTIDPSAAHYQDPEARLKLRVYLASPQKFDEAIEFGFPSTDVLSSGGFTVGNTASATAPSAAAQRQRNMRQSTSNGSNSLRTFLVGDDDDDKLDSDQASVPDPESPKTPHMIPDVAGPGCTGASKAPFRPYRLSTEPSLCHRPSDSYAQVPANSREMTLRMTLTRLDLRADEDQIYGLQQPPYHVQGSGHQAQPSLSRKSTSTMPNYTLKSDDEYLHDGGATPKMSISPALLSTPSMAGAAMYTGTRPKESIENVFAGIDHWEAVEQDKGVMKRFWNRVRRS